MFYLTKKFKFEASHLLTYHDGLCSNLHGHSYKFEIKLKGNIDNFNSVEDNPKGNMLLDFSDLKEIVEPIIKEFLDHKHLNDSLKTSMPTAEFIASFIYYKIKSLLSYMAIKEYKHSTFDLYSVIVYETETSSAEYSEHIL